MAHSKFFFHADHSPLFPVSASPGPRMKTRDPLGFRIVVAVVGSLVLGAFSIVTVVYNLPSDPLRAAIGPALQAMDPWLAQNWSFFAPDPPTTDTGVLVRYSQATGEHDEAQSFVDITTPGLTSVKNTFLPNREYRMLSSSLSDFLSAEDSLVSEANSAEDSAETEINQAVSDSLQSASVSQATKSRYFRSRLVLLRVVCHFYEIAQGRPSSCEDPAAVQLRIVEYQYPRFAEKDSVSSNDIHVRTLPWWELR